MKHFHSLSNKFLVEYFKFSDCDIFIRKFSSNCRGIFSMIYDLGRYVTDVILF